MRLSLFAVLLVVPVVLADDPEPPPRKTPVARELQVTNLPIANQREVQELSITTAQQARDLFGKDLADQILKQVDLKKERLLLFRWAGSGQDELTMKPGNGSVTFRLTRGQTKDRQQHRHLYAMPLQDRIEVGWR